MVTVIFIFFTDQTQAESLTVKVNEAVQLLNDYNGRLLKEMEDRKLVTKMLHDFTAAQKELLVQAEERLQVKFELLYIPTETNCLYLKITGVQGKIV